MSTTPPVQRWSDSACWGQCSWPDMPKIGHVNPNLPIFALVLDLLNYKVFPTPKAGCCKYKCTFLWTQTIIILTTNTLHKEMCLLWTSLHTSIQSHDLSQTYFRNLQWANTEACQLKPESIKSPFPAIFSLCNETTGFYICPGERILQGVPGQVILICSLIRNVFIAPTLPEESSLRWGLGSWLKHELEMLCGLYWWILLAFSSCFLCGVPVRHALMTSTSHSLHKNADCSHPDFLRVCIRATWK